MVDILDKPIELLTIMPCGFDGDSRLALIIYKDGTEQYHCEHNGSLCNGLESGLINLEDCPVKREEYGL
jgi:hypothetical protein